MSAVWTVEASGATSSGPSSCTIPISFTSSSAASSIQIVSLSPILERANNQVAGRSRSHSRGFISNGESKTGTRERVSSCFAVGICPSAKSWSGPLGACLLAGDGVEGMERRYTVFRRVKPAGEGRERR
jgi:hypothetical protein